DPYAPADLHADLLAAGYEDGTKGPNRFVRRGDAFEVTTAAASIGGVAVRAGTVTVRLVDGHVAEAGPGDVVLRPTRLAVVGDVDAARSRVTQAELPPAMAAALLAIEDARFRDHVGVDPIGLLRAVVQDLRGKD